MCGTGAGPFGRAFRLRMKMGTGGGVVHEGSRSSGFKRKMVSGDYRGK